MEKRGVVAIVAIVMIVLMVVVSIAIVWVGILPLVSKANLDKNVDLQLVSSEGYTLWDAEHRLAIVQVARGIDESDLAGFNIVFILEGNSVMHFIEDVPGINSKKVYYINLTNYSGRLDLIQLVPVFKDGVFGDITSELEVYKIAEDIVKLIEDGEILGEDFVELSGGGALGSGGSSSGSRKIIDDVFVCEGILGCANYLEQECGGDPCGFGGCYFDGDLGECISGEEIREPLEANIASRITGVAPLGVFFDSVSEYRVMSRITSNISGVNFYGGDHNNPVGTGALEFDGINSIRWRAPGDAFGEYVNIETNEDIYVQLISGNGYSTVYVNVPSDHDTYPTSVVQDSIEVSVGESTGTIQPRGFDRLSRACQGVEVTMVSINNELGSGEIFCYNDGTVSWRAPGDIEGALVDITKGGEFILVSGNGESRVFVWVDESSYSFVDFSDLINVVDGGDNADWNVFSFEWNFGDSDSGYWTTGAVKSDGSYYSKDKAFGPIAAHIYEEFGSYRATLKIIDDVGNIYLYYKDIEVLSEPSGGWTTYYFSNDGDDDLGNGSEANPFATSEKAESLFADDVKILFKRGDVFEFHDSWYISSDGLYIGAYGVGERPVINITINSYFIYGDYASDLKIMDLNIINTRPIEETRRSSTGFSYMSPDSIYKNLRLQDLGIVFSFTTGQNNRPSNAIVQESEVVGSIMGVWASSAPKGAVLGSNFTDARNYSGEIEALYRLYNDKMITSHNYYARPSPNKNTIRFMRNEGGFGRWYVVSYNKLDDGATGLSISADSNYRMPKQFLIEGNDGANINIYGGDYIMIRNNRLILDKLTEFVKLLDGYNGKDYYHKNIYILNNLMFGTADAARFFLGEVPYSLGYNLVLKNNIIYNSVITDTLYTFFLRTGIKEYAGINLSDSQAVSDNNLIYLSEGNDLFRGYDGEYNLSGWRQLTENDLNSLTSEPVFSDLGNEDFSLTSGSVGIDDGETMPWVRIDADQNYRDLELGNDMGPYEA